MPSFAFDSLADLVLPRRCIGCGRAGAGLCAACRPACGPAAVEGGAVIAVAEYAGPVRTALLAYKERGRRDLVGPLGGLLGEAVCGAVRAAAVGGGHGPERPVLVAVPSTRAAAAARGGDHVVRLARRAAVASGIRVAPRTVGLVRGVRDSAGLGVAERADNLAGAMRARRAPSGLCAILVDDIVTTGATLREARRALIEAGWPVLGAAVVAATPRRRDPARVDPSASGSSTGHTQGTGLA